MSKLDELIAELCPDGVPYKTLGELGYFYGGLSGKSKEDFTNGNAKFITYMNVFTNLAIDTDISDLVRIGENEKQNTVQYGDILFTGSSETPDECGMSSVLTEVSDEKFYLNSFCFGFRLKDNNLLLPDFSKYLFRSQNIRKQIKRTANGVTRFNVSKKKMEQVVIPLPPLPVQQEIVRILDNFTELTAELTTELTARRKQYEYYRDLLLTFGDDVPRLAISDLLIRTKGTNITAQKMRQLHKENGEVRIFAGGKTYADVDFKDIPKKDINFNPSIIVKSRGIIEFEYYDKPFSHKNEFWSYYSENKNVNIKFVYYYLSRNVNYFQRIANNMQMPQISIPVTDKYKVPLPPIKEQERIVSILDRFDALCNDLTSGLPAEIEARQKQYEYYRDKLLSFKEVTA